MHELTIVDEGSTSALVCIKKSLLKTQKLIYENLSFVLLKHSAILITDRLSLRLVETVGAKTNVRSSPWALSMT